MIPRRLVTLFVAGASLAFGLILSEMTLLAGQGRSTAARPTPQQPQGPPRGGGRGGGPPSPLPSLVTDRWWQNETLKTDLALSPQLVTRLDSRYTEFREDFTRMFGELRKLEGEMEALIAKREVTPDELALKAVAAEAIRARMSETRTVMYYGSTQQLRPEQYAKLRTWWQARTGRGGASRQPSFTFSTWEWWKDEAVKKELALTEQAAAEIERSYQRRIRRATPLVEDLQKESEALDAMIAAREVHENTVAAKIVQVEALRSRINETRTVMHYRFFQLLTPEQHQKFEALVKNRGRGRGGQ